MLPASQIEPDDRRSNVKKANKVLSRLGGMPHGIVSESPTKESMLLCVTCLCARLLSSSAEERACARIQAAWRSYQERKLRWEQQRAARVIWRIWSRHREAYFARQVDTYGPAVAVIESFVLKFQRRLRYLRLKRALAVTRMQVRKYLL